MSKAEARLQLAQRIYFRFEAQWDVFLALQARATRDVQAIEDAVFLDTISNAIAAHLYPISG